MTWRVALGIGLALVVLVGLSFVGTRVATRNGHDDAVLRGPSAGVLLFGALIAVGTIAFVFVGTIDGMSGETYTGRQVLYLELSLVGSIALAVLLTMAAWRLLRRPPEPPVS